MEGIIFVPLVLFVAVVLPIWLMLHYGTRWRRSQGLTPTERRRLDNIFSTAHQLEKRIKTMETILDAEMPGWRANHDR